MKIFKWRKNNYKPAYIILPVVLLLLIALTAFMCNLCSVPEQANNQGSNVVADIAEEENDEDDNDYGKKDNTGKKDDVQNEKSSPSIELVIYEGPLFSNVDNVCYYRIEAKVKGYPEPVVKFSKDDSNGAWGKYRAQVNLKKGQEYTLIANASNSIGEASDSMLLKYTEDGKPGNPDNEGKTNNDDIADGDDEEILTFTAPIVSEHTGYFVAGQNGYSREGGCIFIGDAPATAQCPQPMPCTGFLTYRMDGINGKKITEAKIEFKLGKKWGDTSIFDNFIISVFDENNAMLPMQSFSSGCGGSFTLNHPDFTAFIQKSLNMGETGLEVYCQFDPYTTDNDDSWDGWEYQQSDIIFKVKYIK
ncbi:MAG: hypothetical protein FJW68_05870 [Actinobacteria bacterium]|nr:hypothetical protein [Actinomycetota bacterium]